MTVDAARADKWPHLHYTHPGDKIDHPRSHRRSRPCRVACVVILATTCAVFFTAGVLLWFTSFFEDTVHRGLVFQEGGPMFSGWKQPPMKPLVRVYVYNYTNTQEFLLGKDSKLRVEEVGPYAYWETLERVNVQFLENGTMSYNERRTHVFNPAMSGGAEDDILMVPNLPLFGAVAKMRDASYLTQITFRGVLWASRATPFSTLNARDFLFGYNSTLYDIAKTAATLSGDGALPKLGLLATRSGLNNDTYTIWTGRDDYRLLDTVVRHRGRSALSAWEDPDCNRIDGSEGTFFPLDPLSRHEPVYLFNGGICRRLKLEFKSEVTVMDGIPALRYGPPDNFFHSPEDNPDNKCYRHSGSQTIVPSGVFNNSPCAYGSPTFLSFPHFYLGDPKLRNVVEGIDPPDPEKHQLFFNIHPVLGMNLGAVSRMQINIMVRQASLISDLNSFNDGDIIPVAWIETIANQFPAETKRAVYHATFTLRAVEHGMMYAFPVMCLITAMILGCLLIPCGPKPPREKELPVTVIKLT